MPIGVNTLRPEFKPSLAKPGFISHENSDLKHGLKQTKTRFDQTRFKPWFYPLKLRSRPDMKNWPEVSMLQVATLKLAYHTCAVT